MSDALSLKAQLSVAVADRFSSYTGVFISDGGRNQFSGVFLKTLGKYFILTAKHCLEDVDDASTVILATKRNSSPGIAVDISECRLHEKLDLAVIVVKEQDQENWDADWFEVSDLSSHSIVSRSVVCALGFPADFFKKLGEGVPVFRPCPHIYTSEVSKRWPRGNFKVAAAKENDFFIERDVDDTVGEDGVLLPPYSPRGMSGCGVYVVPRPTETSVWSPADARLAGILVSVVEQDTLIRCIRIEHILSLCGYKIRLRPKSED